MERYEFFKEQLEDYYLIYDNQEKELVCDWVGNTLRIYDRDEAEQICYDINK